jgi:hypothetical protein
MTEVKPRKQHPFFPTPYALLSTNRRTKLPPQAAI